MSTLLKSQALADCKPTADLTGAITTLVDFIARHPRLFVLTGAGCSTDSGIPDYRDADGDWKRKQPVQFQNFVRSAATRQRYWARSMLGWRSMAAARPNVTHRALARLEKGGFVRQLVTQNVDGLHQQAGSRQVIALHGELASVVCLDCGRRGSRAAVQQTLVALNPDFERLMATDAPDGDADLENVDFSRFQPPVCPACGGMVKPDVVFFGESVPRERVEAARAALRAADAVLVVGSSLMVYSGYRFCRWAGEQGIPIAAVNLGRTRADAELSLKISGRCGPVLAGVVEALGSAEWRDIS